MLMGNVLCKFSNKENDLKLHHLLPQSVDIFRKNKAFSS